MRAESVSDLLSQLEVTGIAHDAKHDDRSSRFLNITRDTGEFLSVLACALAVRRVLEVGTSNGYSTLWLAEAANQSGGHVITIEQSVQKAALAARNFRRADLENTITQVCDDGGNALSEMGDGSQDLIFLDADRQRYVAWWPEVRRVIRPRGVVVVDNAISHSSEVESFVRLVQADDSFRTCLVAVGNGEFLAVKA